MSRHHLSVISHTYDQLVPVGMRMRGMHPGKSVRPIYFKLHPATAGPNLAYYSIPCIEIVSRGIELAGTPK